MAERLIIVGAGGLGREVLWTARALSDRWEPLGFLDDDERLRGRSISELPVLGRIDDWPRYHEDARVVVALGAPRIRKAVVERLEALAATRFATLVHPSVHENRYGSVGEGSILCAGSLYSDRTRIGRHCLINALSTLGHDAVLGDFCTLASHVGVCGNVTLAPGVELGTGVVVVPGITIGQGSLCCAGAVVANPVAPAALVAGNPARRVKDLPAFS